MHLGSPEYKLPQQRLDLGAQMTKLVLSSSLALLTCLHFSSRLRLCGNKIALKKSGFMWSLHVEITGTETLSPAPHQAQIKDSDWPGLHTLTTSDQSLGHKDKPLWLVGLGHMPRQHVFHRHRQVWSQEFHWQCFTENKLPSRRKW